MFDVQRGDQLLGRVQFELRDLRISPESRFALGPFRRVFQQLQQPPNAEQRQRKSGREQRVDHSRRGRQHRPFVAPHHTGTKCHARRVHERMHDPSVAELVPHRRQGRQQPLPGCRPSPARTACATGSVSAAPALVIPLLNRSTQIHPPGKT